MRNAVFLSVCVGAFLSCGHVAAQSNKEEYSRKACIELFAAKELLLTKFSVSAKFDVKLDPESERAVTSATEEYAFQEKSEACRSTMQTREGKTNTHWWRYDGTKLMQMMGGNHYEMGEIKKGRLITWMADPREWICYSGSHPLSEILNRITDKQFLAQVLNKDGRPILRLTLGPISHEGRWTRGVFEFDIERGHALISETSEIRFDLDQDWAVYNALTLEDFTETIDQVWVPGHMVQTSYRGMTDSPNSPTFDSQTVGEISDWKFGDSCDTSVLSIKFPVGMTVVDSIKNEVFTAGEYDF